MMHHQAFYPGMNSGYASNSYPMSPFQNSQMPQTMIPGGVQNPAQTQGQQLQEPPTNFRSEYQGILHGLNCWVNLMYAGLGMVSYGRTFFDMSVSVMRTVGKVVAKIMFKLFGFQFLGKFMNWLNSFRSNREIYNELWAGMAPQGSAQTGLGKVLLALRILLLLGMGASYLIKRKLEKRQLLKKQEMESQENTLNTKEIISNLTMHPEVTETMNETNETEESKNPIEEKLEKALDEEVNKNKELFMNLRSEDFWNNKTPHVFQETVTLEEAKEEKVDSLKSLNADKTPLEPVQDPFKAFYENQVKEPIIAEVKKEKITAPAGAKPWKTLKKTN